MKRLTAVGIGLWLCRGIELGLKNLFTGMVLKRTKNAKLMFRKLWTVVGWAKWKGSYSKLSGFKIWNHWGHGEKPAPALGGIILMVGPKEVPDGSIPYTGSLGKRTWNCWTMFSMDRQTWKVHLATILLPRNGNEEKTYPWPAILKSFGRIWLPF